MAETDRPETLREKPQQPRPKTTKATPRKRSGGRQDLTLTRARHEAIVESVRCGNYYKTSAKAAGVPLSTFYEWMQKGRETTRQPFRKFYLDVASAREVAVDEHVKSIHNAGFTQWQAHAWLLERTDPGRFGRRDPAVAELERKVAELEGRLAAAADSGRRSDPQREGFQVLGADGVALDPPERATDEGLPEPPTG
jgi:hypothetical protein